LGLLYFKGIWQNCDWWHKNQSLISKSVITSWLIKNSKSLKWKSPRSRFREGKFPLDPSGILKSISLCSLTFLNPPVKTKIMLAMSRDNLAYLHKSLILKELQLKIFLLVKSHLYLNTFSHSSSTNP